MWISNPKGQHLAKRVGANGLVAVAIDKDKASQYALRWAVDNLLGRGQTVILIHVASKSTASAGNAANDAHGAISAHREQLEKQTRELFLTFRCFCTRKEIQCFDVMLEDSCIAKAIAEYATHAAIDHLVLGSSRHGFIRRLKTVDVPTAVLKAAPDFCTIYVISKTKLSCVRNASRQAPFSSPLHDQIYQTQYQAKNNSQSQSGDAHPKYTFSLRDAERTPRRYPTTRNDYDLTRSPFAKGSPSLYGKQHGDLSESESDISFISSNRPSSDRMSMMLYDSTESGQASRASINSDSSYSSEWLGSRGSEISSIHDHLSSSSLESDDMEAEMRRLKEELLKTMNLYSTACREAIAAKHKATELHRWRVEEERRLHEVQHAEEEALQIAENKKVKHGATIEDADAVHRIAELEAQKRLITEKKALQEKEEKYKMDHFDFRYRRYTINEIEEATEFFAEIHKIGEGGYGPVFKCSLDHTTVAVKVLRPDATQGRSQFHQEIEVLSCMRHPNIVLLVGACPEYGCLVYEYLANGSLEDRLFRRGNTPPLSWQLRFRIIAEIATGLLFLHRTKPEPIVHRDLKPANILLDQNFVSKISDVGLARLIPPSISDDVTQYRLTSAAGTFCYIDPEYQQTGMLGVKSDIYSLGIILLQMITAKPAMGLTRHVAGAIENETFKEILDPHVPDWPIEETLSLAKLSLQCAQLMRKDRPDLEKIILPELSKLRAVAEENFSHCYVH